MYIVRFVRKDGMPDEEYYYHRLEDAQSHVELFKNDDSGLYEKSEIVDDRFQNHFKTYLLRLIYPNDAKDEEYWYSSIEKAEHHFSEVITTNNDDYFVAQILEYPSFAVVKQTVLLGFTDGELAMVRDYSKGDQFDTAVALLTALQDADEQVADVLLSARLKLAKLNPRKYLMLREILSR